MGKTIIQTIGPLYGEVVNGTVFGRPNGSVYVPASNTIHLTIPTNLLYIRKNNTTQFVPTNSAGQLNPAFKVSVVAEAQDISSYIGIHIEDSGNAVVGSDLNATAGQFNITFNYVGLAGEETLTDGATYYVVATLYSSSGVAVAVDKVEVTGVVP